MTGICKLELKAMNIHSIYVIYQNMTPVTHNYF